MSERNLKQFIEVFGRNELVTYEGHDYRTFVACADSAHPVFGITSEDVKDYALFNRTQVWSHWMIGEDGKLAQIPKQDGPVWELLYEYRNSESTADQPESK